MSSKGSQTPAPPLIRDDEEARLILQNQHEEYRHLLEQSQLLIRVIIGSVAVVLAFANLSGFQGWIPSFRILADPIGIPNPLPSVINRAITTGVMMTSTLSLLFLARAVAMISVILSSEGLQPLQSNHAQFPLVRKDDDLDELPFNETTGLAGWLKMNHGKLIFLKERLHKAYITIGLAISSFFLSLYLALSVATNSIWPMFLLSGVAVLIGAYLLIRVSQHESASDVLFGDILTRNQTHLENMVTVLLVLAVIASSVMGILFFVALAVVP